MRAPHEKVPSHPHVKYYSPNPVVEHTNLKLVLADVPSSSAAKIEAALTSVGGITTVTTTTIFLGSTDTKAVSSTTNPTNDMIAD